MYILWLASWFPNRTSPLNGDFIERHALAASYDNDILVLHIVKDPVATETSHEWRNHGLRCRSLTIYYPQKSNISLLEKLCSAWQYFYLQWKFTRKYFMASGKPSLVHVHITIKAGFFAYLLKIFYGLPYIVSEQDTRFLRADPSSYQRKSWPVRFILGKILSASGGLSAVSLTLQEEMGRMAPGLRSRLIPNVVNGDIFHPGMMHPFVDVFRMIHISNFSPQKNTAKILAAMRILNEQAPGQFHLIMVGPQVDQKTEEEFLATGVEFRKEMKQSALADLMRNSHALILYSLYETFGCVIIEAMACGIPAILADTPVSRELVNEGENGITVLPNQQDALAKSIVRLRDSYGSFDGKKISRDTLSKYGYPAIAPMFSNWYAEMASNLSL